MLGELGLIRSRIDGMHKKLKNIGSSLITNQQEIDDIGNQEERVRNALRDIELNVGALGSSLSGDRVDENTLLDALEDAIEDEGLLVGRWLLKEGPCDNFFIKDTKRGGWYKFPKTTENHSVYGEPEGEMLDV